MIAIIRFRVPPEAAEEFVVRAEAAVRTLSGAPGFRTADLARNLDEPTLWTITTRWDNVGSYRRALGSYDAKMTAVPLLSLAIDEPTAYEELAKQEL
jgi:quinol monooxygenase YgiN